MLTEQNYVTIQKIIAANSEKMRTRGGMWVEMVEKAGLVEMLSKYFELDNPRFSRRMFFDGCNS